MRPIFQQSCSNGELLKMEDSLLFFLAGYIALVLFFYLFAPAKEAQIKFTHESSLPFGCIVVYGIAVLMLVQSIFISKDKSAGIVVIVWAPLIWHFHKRNIKSAVKTARNNFFIFTLLMLIGLIVFLLNNSLISMSISGYLGVMALGSSLLHSIYYHLNAIKKSIESHQPEPNSAAVPTVGNNGANWQKIIAANQYADSTITNTDTISQINFPSKNQSAQPMEAARATEAHIQKNNDSRIRLESRSKSVGVSIEEESLWEKALNEYDSPERKKGVWAKLYADFEGDEVKIKTAYLKTRVQQLKDESLRAIIADEEQRKVSLLERFKYASFEDCYKNNNYEIFDALGFECYVFFNGQAGIKQFKHIKIYESQDALIESLTAYQDKGFLLAKGLIKEVEISKI